MAKKSVPVPSISCVLPTYNRADIISHAISSIMDQSFPDWELIIVDDGSTDNTKLICEKFCEQDDRIKYYKIHHTGKIGKVRNFGNRKARGTLIIVQDSDDVSLPDRFDVLWTEYQQTKADVLYHALYQIFTYEFTPLRLRRFKPAIPYDKQLLLSTQYIPGQVAYTRKAILKVPYDERILISDDWQVLLELALQGYKFHNINRALYEYWFTPDSVTLNGGKDGKRKHDMLLLLKMLNHKYKLSIPKATFINYANTGEEISREEYK